MLGVAHRRADLGELLDGVPDLLVQDHAIGDDDDRVEDVGVVLPQADELERQPSDGVGLAAPSRMFNKIATPGTMLGHVRQELSYDVELVVPGKIWMAFFRPVRSSFVSTTWA